MAVDANNRSVFELRASFRDPVRQKLFSLMRGSIERLFLLDQLDHIYQCASRGADGNGDFLAAVMQHMRISYDVSPEDRQRICGGGPVVVVANHPFGGIEGIVLLRLLQEIRPDVKMMANYLLSRMPELGPHSFFVDPFDLPRSPTSNVRPIKECIRWIRDGHMLMVFPSGTVSHLKLHEGVVADPKWSGTIARIIRMTEAPAQPVFVEGRNGALFQLMGLIHPRLRTAMLPRELINKQGTTLRFHIGSVVPFERLRQLQQDDEMMEYLRLRTYILMGRGQNGVRVPAPPLRPARRAELPPVADALHPDTIAQDIALLPAEAQLLESDDFVVYATAADQIPNVLHEIGRLREVTFRAAGEGTGRASDLDRFDHHYHHLLLWNRAKRELVGAYRVGRSDEILARKGKKGLYTSTLFRYSRALLDHMGPSLELGRSFVRPEYQRSYSALLLLWKGIGRMVVREPRYRHLFGPVSINNEYNTLSRQMMEQFMRANNFRRDWARFVKPRHPPGRVRRQRWNPEIFRRTITTTDDMSDLVGEIERDRKGIPVLLKQYLKLGGKLLGFNVDPEFSDVLDGLIWVDLLDLDPRILARFLGREGATSFRAYHGRAMT